MDYFDPRMWTVKRIVNEYNWIMEKASDPRTSDWFLMDSPIPTMSVVFVFLVFIFAGTKWMRKREAYNLKDTIMTYNFCLVALNAYIFYEFLVSAWLNPKFSKLCQRMDYSNDPLAVRLANACWWFYFSKIIELMDTIFFVLRKKNRQISFLHVYHHSTMPLLWWIGVKFVPGGESYLSGSINSFIHVLMYTYYFLAAMGPVMQKYLWWKKYMTVLQLVQFWWIFVHTLSAIYFDCGYPNAYNWALVAYVMSHILLFTNFFIQTYIKKAKQARSNQTERTKVSSDKCVQGKKENGNIRQRH